MRPTTLALAALALTIALAAPLAAAHLIPQEDAVDEAVMTASGIAIGAMRDGITGGQDAAQGTVSQVAEQSAQTSQDANDLVQQLTGVANGAVGAANDGAALVLAQGGDGAGQAQVLSSETTQRAVSSMLEGRGLAERSVGRLNGFTDAAGSPLAPMVGATLDAIPRPDTPVAFEVGVDFSALVDTLEAESPVDVLVQGPDVVAIQDAVFDYGAAAAASPTGILAPGAAYSSHMVTEAGGFVVQSEGDAIGTSLVVIELFAH